MSQPELGLFSGIHAKPQGKEETIEFFSATSSQISGLSNVRRQSFSSKGSRGSRSSRSLGSRQSSFKSNNSSSIKGVKSLLGPNPNNADTPDSKNTEQTVATLPDSPSVISAATNGSGDVFAGVKEDSVVPENASSKNSTNTNSSMMGHDSSTISSIPASGVGVPTTTSLSRSNMASVTRKLEYDEETGQVQMNSQPVPFQRSSGSVMSQPVVAQHSQPSVPLQRVQSTPVVPSNYNNNQKDNNDGNVEVTMWTTEEEDEIQQEEEENHKNDPQQQEEEEPPAATTKAPPSQLPQKRSLVPFFIVGAICLVIGGVFGSVIARNDPEYKARMANPVGNSGPSSSSWTMNDSSDDGESPTEPTATPTTSPPTMTPTTSAPTVFVPTLRPTRTPTGTPTRKPTQAPTTPNQALGRGDRLQRLHYALGGSCHKDADHWFLNVDTWGQLAWQVNTAPNRDQLWMERYIMACIYYRLFPVGNPIATQQGGKWLSSEHVCEWDQGTNTTVAMNCTETGEVTRLEASQLANVNGTFPSEIGSLTSLTKLGFTRPASLIGVIPSELSQLQLSYFRCIQCSLNGTIPSQLGRLTNLTTLFLGDSDDKERYLTGSIPSSIGRLTLLQTLSIRNARLTGTIPSEIINLWNLTELYLTGNRMNGDIPPLPANLTECELAGLSYNGDFPEENCFPNIDDTVCTHWSQNCKRFP